MTLTKAKSQNVSSLSLVCNKIFLECRLFLHFRAKKRTKKYVGWFNSLFYLWKCWI